MYMGLYRWMEDLFWRFVYFEFGATELDSTFETTAMLLPRQIHLSSTRQ